MIILFLRNSGTRRWRSFTATPWLCFNLIITTWSIYRSILFLKIGMSMLLIAKFNGVIAFPTKTTMSGWLETMRISSSSTMWLTWFRCINKRQRLINRRRKGLIIAFFLNNQWIHLVDRRKWIKYKHLSFHNIELIIQTS